MPDPIDLLSIADALALCAAVPDVVQSEGATPVITRAEACEIARIAKASPTSSGWRVQFPRTRRITVGSETAQLPAGPLTLLPEQVADQWITATHPDGRVFRIPAIAIQTFLGFFYVQLETGEIVPRDLTPAAPQA